MELDLDAIETDLADVEIALARLESGQYWTCEVTGAPLDEALLAANPVARHAPTPDQATPDQATPGQTTPGQS